LKSSDSKTTPICAACLGHGLSSIKAPPRTRRWGHNRHFAAQAALAAPQREH
jgi:hypothetical protein